MLLACTIQQLALRYIGAWDRRYAVGKMVLIGNHKYADAVGRDKIP